MNYVKEAKVIQIGGSRTVVLTEPLKMLEINKEDTVVIKVVKDKITIEKV